MADENVTPVAPSATPEVVPVPSETPPTTPTTLSAPAAAEKKYTDKDLDDIISKKFGKWQEEKSKEINEAKLLAEMDEKQKAEYQRDQLQKKLDELTNANTINEMSKTARKMLSEKDVSVDDELLALLVSSDAESTKKVVDGFAVMFKIAVEKAVAEKVKGTTPKTGSTVKMTKEQIMQIKDATERQQAIKDNIGLFQ